MVHLHSWKSIYYKAPEAKGTTRYQIFFTRHHPRISFPKLTDSREGKLVGRAIKIVKVTRMVAFCLIL
jgi:hypothetical protein